MTADDAKAQFDQLLDTVRREPISIEKHGRRVAVMISPGDHDDLIELKLERLRAEVQIGIDEIERGEFIELDEDGLQQLIDEIKTEGRRATNPGGEQ